MTNLINKNGQISKTAYEKVSGHGYGFSTKKLSDLYSSRSTRYPSIYDTDLFVITKDKAAIVAAGYSPLCKAIISLNEKNELVQRILKMEVERKSAEKVSKEIEAAKREAAKDAIMKEAKSFKIDDQFKAALKWASESKGKDKSDRMASAMKGLIDRNGKDAIVTDFWQVFRILKSYSESK